MALLWRCWALLEANGLTLVKIASHLATSQP